MIKCLALNQLKMIPKNVKNHSNCASGITSHLLCGLTGRHHDLLHLLHRVCFGKLFPGLNLWLGNDHLITSSFALVPFEGLEQAFLIFWRCAPLGDL